MGLFNVDLQEQYIDLYGYGCCFVFFNPFGWLASELVVRLVSMSCLIIHYPLHYLLLLIELW